MELLIEGTVLGYFPADRLVQIQPADGSKPVELYNSARAGNVDFNQHLGKRCRVVRADNERGEIVTVRFLEDA